MWRGLFLSFLAAISPVPFTTMALLNASPPEQAPGIVLDTNVVLDWLLFDNPAMAAAGRAITTGRVRWLRSAAMAEEFRQVVVRDALRRWQPDVAMLLAQAQRWALPVTPLAQAGRVAPICTDPDDQIFIDTAIGHNAKWLLTRDNALLKLARRAAGFGVLVTTPIRWSHTP